MRKLTAIISLWALALATGLSAAPRPILIAAAISLQAALEEIASHYPGPEKLAFHFAASGTLQKQIERGAPVDIFIAAGQKPLTAIRPLLRADTITSWLGNRLVIVVPKGSAPITSAADLQQSRFKHIALGDPQTVPAGQYATETMESLHLRAALAPRLVYAQHVRQVLSYVEQGLAEAGFVYASELSGRPRAQLAWTVPAELHRPIVYPAGILKSSRAEAASRRVLAYLSSPPSRVIFERFGFSSSAPGS